MIAAKGSRAKAPVKAALGVVLVFGLVLVLLPASAQANRALQTKTALNTFFCLDCPPPPLNPEPPFNPPPEGQIEGACGIAVSPLNGNLYVSDYYHHLVDVFSSGGAYQSQFPVNPLNGVCQLAFDSAGNLYANQWHESVVRLKPTPKVFDEGESTGVAVDGAGNVYVNDRTYVAVYEPSGEPVLDEGQPLKIGLGSLGDAYGLAVFGGRVYVADASDNTVKVYEPATDPANPIATISPPGGFTSLTDASVAIDPTNAHLIVIDNLQPGFIHPKGGVKEFTFTGTFLGQLKTTVIDAEPSGVAVSATGTLYVTSGNSEGANVFRFGPYTESGPDGVGGDVEAPASGAQAIEATAAVGRAVMAPSVTSDDTAGTTDAATRRQARKARRRARQHRAERQRHLRLERSRALSR